MLSLEALIDDSCDLAAACAFFSPGGQKKKKGN
jgi:hypothetical protein